MNPIVAPIAIVDDEPIILSAIRETLRAEHLQTCAFENPLTALEEIKRREFSVIITDQRMPALSGLDLLRQAREIQPDATRVLITAVPNLDTVVSAVNHGEIFRFILKPWLREEFVTTVRNALQRYELICENKRLHSETDSLNARLMELNRSLEQQIELVRKQNQQLAQANSALEKNLSTSLELCVRTMETFNPVLGQQARRAHELCQRIANLLELAPAEKRILESSALLYDIGLVAVPREIIHAWQQDPHSLTPEEKSLIEQHPILGQELASFDSDLEKVGEIIRAHHERFDGTGYPDRLAREAIPWLARLLAVAVAWACSCESDRHAIEKIKMGSGSAFDREAVRVFLKALPMTPLPRHERQVSLSEARPGMVLSRGIYSGDGLLLIPEGQALNRTYIEQLLNHNRIQPITEALTVFC